MRNFNCLRKSGSLDNGLSSNRSHRIKSLLRKLSKAVVQRSLQEDSLRVSKHFKPLWSLSIWNPEKLKILFLFFISPTFLLSFLCCSFYGWIAGTAFNLKQSWQLDESQIGEFGRGISWQCLRRGLLYHMIIVIISFGEFSVLQYKLWSIVPVSTILFAQTLRIIVAHRTSHHPSPVSFGWSSSGFT